MRITEDNRANVNESVRQLVSEADEYLGFGVTWDGDYEYVTVKLRTHSPKPDPHKVGYV